MEAIGEALLIQTANPVVMGKSCSASLGLLTFSVNSFLERRIDDSMNKLSLRKAVSLMLKLPVFRVRSDPIEGSTIVPGGGEANPRLGSGRKLAFAPRLKFTVKNNWCLSLKL